MNKLKLNRKPVCSLRRIDMVRRLIAEHWDEIWEIVQHRAQTGTNRKNTQVKH